MTLGNTRNPSWKVLKDALDRHSHTVDELLGLGTSTIHKWQEPPSSVDWPDGSGARNILDRMEIILKALTNLGREKQALALLRWQAASIGYEVSLTKKTKRESADLRDELCKLAAENGDVFRAITDALADGRIDPDELREISREIDEAKDQAETVKLVAGRGKQ